jgi:hypothetical protein
MASLLRLLSVNQHMPWLLTYTHANHAAAGVAAAVLCHAGDDPALGCPVSCQAYLTANTQHKTATGLGWAAASVAVAGWGIAAAL